MYIVTHTTGKKMIGVVKWYSAKLGYGYILDDNKNEWRVHYSNIITPGYKVLVKDQLVTFEIENCQAVNVTVFLDKK